LAQTSRIKIQQKRQIILDLKRHRIEFFISTLAAFAMELMTNRMLLRFYFLPDSLFYS